MPLSNAARTGPWTDPQLKPRTHPSGNSRPRSDIMGKGKDTEKLKRKEYEKELEKLHVELVNLQEWVKVKGLKVCIVFEGRDGAGKGGMIKAITERVSPRVFRVVALLRRRSGRSRRCTPSATCRICRRRARWSSSTGAGTTARASSGSWASAPRAGQGVPRGSARLREADRRLRHPSCSSTGSR